MTKVAFLENDLELLTRIKEHDELALEAMFEKYKPLIYTKIKKYNFPDSEKEDYLQEGRIILVKAIDNYREDNKMQKTFTKYFELLLENRFIDLYRINKSRSQYILVGLEEPLVEEMQEEEVQDVKPVLHLSKLEQKVFDLHFVEKMAVLEVCKILHLNEKQIYNTIQRIRKKQNQQK